VVFFSLYLFFLKYRWTCIYQSQACQNVSPYKDNFNNSKKPIDDSKTKLWIHNESFVKLFTWSQRMGNGGPSLGLLCLFPQSVDIDWKSIITFNPPLKNLWHWHQPWTLSWSFCFWSNFDITPNLKELPHSYGSNYAFTSKLEVGHKRSTSTPSHLLFMKHGIVVVKKLEHCMLQCSHITLHGKLFTCSLSQIQLGSSPHTLVNPCAFGVIPNPMEPSHCSQHYKQFHLQLALTQHPLQFNYNYVLLLD
jgi:hypothetical protein